MVPANTRLALKLNHAIFEDLGPEVETKKCDIKKSYGRYEPSNKVKGDIARILAYMKTTYKLDIGVRVAMLKRWSNVDPVNAEEKNRDAAIKKIQGNSNPFVLNPEKMNQLQD